MASSSISVTARMTSLRVVCRIVSTSLWEYKLKWMWLSFMWTFIICKQIQAPAPDGIIRLLHSIHQLSQIEIAFAASTMCLWVCVYSAWRETCYVSPMCKYVFWNWSFQYKIQYEIHYVWPGQFKSWLKYTNINNYHWFTNPKIYIQCIRIFQR